MYEALFRNWKVAALWAVGISASAAAFFADGGGHEQIEASAQQISAARQNPYREDAAEPEPAAAPAASPASEAEPAEPAEPDVDQPEDGGGGADGDQQPAEDQEAT